MTDSIGKEEEDQYSIFPKQTKNVTYEDLMKDLSVFEDVYKKYEIDQTSGILHDYYAVPSYKQATITTTPSWQQNPFSWHTTISTDSLKTYQTSPRVSKTDCKVEVTTDEGSIEHVTREELLKYIDERKIIKENELVRKLYERFQVALKLARSDDNGDQGV